MERLQNLSPEQMDKLLENLVQKMVDEGQITIQEPSEQQANAPGSRATARTARSSSR